MPTNTDTIYFKCRSELRNQVLNLLGSFKKPRPGIHILNGHRIQKETEPETFRKLLYALSKDDGFMECYDIFAPVLEEFGTNAIFFINPN